MKSKAKDLAIISIDFPKKKWKKNSWSLSNFPNEWVQLQPLYSQENQQFKEKWSTYKKKLWYKTSFSFVRVFSLSFEWEINS